ncbi:CatB-related O-acetyltransferase [Aggregatibacter sp. oral taxon 513]|uniref:CatB-related O-acetyltransferase n=1 Tax=Aggregatibacter sp. oral taxon 513 TaxID=712150 RepID=UPI001BAAD67A|nr:CatB-related O-acetyltransferase [Aggregatibacter sp. oral taxon 513]QUC06111.1 CatB-related O-acetyltransferase [Aggregatibacter sp. oral taxon 513]
MKLKEWFYKILKHNKKEKFKDVKKGNQVQFFIEDDLIITDDCEIGDYSYLHKGMFKNTKIGRYCSIATGVKIGLDNHPINWLSTHPFQYADSYTNFLPKRTHIGNDVWLGADVIILSGLTIGDGAIIGAGSVVTKDIPPYAIAVGAPAKVIKYRFEQDIISKLLKLKWWELGYQDLQNVDFDNIYTAIEQIKRIKQGIDIK